MKRKHAEKMAEISMIEKKDRARRVNNSTHILQRKFPSGYGTFKLWEESRKDEAGAAALVKMSWEGIESVLAGILETLSDWEPAWSETIIKS
jgi:hypothetical protein